MAAGHGTWTRRQFSQAIAATAASSFLARGAVALTPARPQGFAFVSTSAVDATGGTISVYRVSGGTWRPAHRVAAASPTGMLLHPVLPVLYVLHDVDEWDHLPRGAVSAYAIEMATGRLALRGTQPLSLAATNPRSAAITADGSALLVAAQTGGIYNLLPITGDGGLARITAIRKECGHEDGEKTAAPGHLVTGSDGAIFAADAGQETITRFDVQRGSLTLAQRTRVHAGAGPSSLCVSPCGQRAYVTRDAGDVLSVHDIDAAGLCAAREEHTLTGSSAPLLMHPSGRFLVAADDASLQVLRVHGASGRLTPQSRSAQPRLEHLRFTADGAHLLGVEPASGQVMLRRFDPASGTLSGPRVVARESGVTSLVMSA